MEKICSETLDTIDYSKTVYQVSPGKFKDVHIQEEISSVSLDCIRRVYLASISEDSLIGDVRVYFLAFQVVLIFVSAM